MRVSWAPAREDDGSVAVAEQDHRETVSVARRV